MQGDKGTGTGYPGKKKGVGGVSLERAQYEAQVASQTAVEDHEFSVDPHPQYTNTAELTAAVNAAKPRFVTFWKWS